MLENDICQKMHIGKKQLQGLVLQEALDILDVNTDHNRTTVEVDSDWLEDDLEDDSSDEGAAFIPGLAYPGHRTARGIGWQGQVRSEDRDDYAVHQKRADSSLQRPPDQLQQQHPDHCH